MQVNIEIQCRALLAALILVAAFPRISSASTGAVLDSNVVWNAYPALPLEGGTQNCRTNGLGVYDWADKNGDGNTNDPVNPTGLNLGNLVLTGTDNINPKPIKLRFNVGPLNAGTGYIESDEAGDIILTKVNAIAMSNGYIRSSGATVGGNILIGDTTNRVGSVQMANLITYGVFGSLGTQIKIQGRSDVSFVSTSNGVLGEVSAFGGAVGVGAITINHDGSFSAHCISNTMLSGGTSGGIALNGDSLGNGYSGTCLIEAAIDTSCRDLVWGAFPTVCGNIGISNYAEVIVGSLAARDLTGGSSGNVQISNVGNITINGDMDLRNDNFSLKGGVDFGATGTIRFEALNLNRVNYVSFWTGSGSHYINGTLYGTNGLAASGFNSFKSALRAASGQNILYNPAANVNLNGATIALTNCTLTGQGGFLTPYPASRRNLLIPTHDSSISAVNVFWP